MKRLGLSSPTSMVFVGWLIVLTLIPFLLILGMSFLTISPVGDLQFTPTLENYKRCFDSVYLTVLIKTIVLGGVATLTCCLVGFPVAYYLARTQGRLKNLGLIFLFIPFWTNFILRIYSMVSILGNHGLFNEVLLQMGIISEPIQILYTRTGVYLGLLYNYLPFFVVPVFSALEKLDPVLREAAWDLGANRRQTLFKVIIPNVREGVIVGSLFVFIPMMGEYVIPDLLGGAKEAFLGNVMVSQFYVVGDWPFGSAIAGLMALLLLSLLYLYTRKNSTTREALL